MHKSVRASRSAAVFAGSLLLLVSAAPVGLMCRHIAQRKRDDALIRAIQSKNTTSALNLLQNGANADARERLQPEETLFQRVKYLWSRQPAAKRVYGSSALQLAVENDLAPVIRDLLLRHAHDLNAHSKATNTENRTDKEPWQASYWERNTEEGPLAVMVMRNRHSDLVWMFLQQGAIQTKEDKEALLCAAANRNNVDMARYLLATGTDANCGAIYDATYHPGKEPPILYAVAHRDLATAQILLENGARAEVPFAGTDSTMTIAAENGDNAMIRLLLAYGAKVDRSVRMGTPLCFAAENNHLEAVKTLIAAGANAKFCGYGGSVLSHAIRADAKQPFQKQTQEKIVSALLRRHADPNENYVGIFLLPEVAATGRTRLVEIMLTYGANVNVIDPDGSTTLSRAVEENHLDTARLLLRYGAQVRYTADREAWVAANDGKPQHLTIDVRNLAKTATMRRLLNQYR